MHPVRSRESAASKGTGLVHTVCQGRVDECEWLGQMLSLSSRLFLSSGRHEQTRQVPSRPIYRHGAASKLYPVSCWSLPKQHRVGQVFLLPCGYLSGRKRCQLECSVSTLFCWNLWRQIRPTTVHSLPYWTGAAGTRPRLVQRVHAGGQDQDE